MNEMNPAMNKSWHYVIFDIHSGMKETRKPLLWLKGEIKTPPFSKAARIEAGELLKRLQIGESLSLPHSRPMPGIGKRCYELRVQDKSSTWRIIHRIDQDAIVILEVFSKKTNATPKAIINTCKQRIRLFDEINREK